MTVVERPKSEVEENVEMCSHFILETLKDIRSRSEGPPNPYCLGFEECPWVLLNVACLRRRTLQVHIRRESPQSTSGSHLTSDESHHRTPQVHISRPTRVTAEHFRFTSDESRREGPVEEGKKITDQTEGVGRP